MPPPVSHLLQPSSLSVASSVCTQYTMAVVRIAETRAMLNALGPRPDAQRIAEARAALSVIDEYLQDELNSLARQQRPLDMDAESWKALQAEQQIEAVAAAEEEKLPYKSVIQLNELHELYAGMLKTAAAGDDSPRRSPMSPMRSPMRPLYITDDIDSDVARLLQEAHDTRSGKLLLIGRRIQSLPESLGSIRSLIILNLSTNCLKVLPESVSRLSKLATLDVSSNQLTSLPDSIGQLKNLRHLNASGNVLKVLPESLSNCYSLVELNASFNQLEKFPSNIGSLFNLEILSLQLNKLSRLPQSICDLASLTSLEVHFNQLLSLPSAIGSLDRLEVLNCSSNFNSLTSLPSSIGDLQLLRDLDLSFNQIKELPPSFGRLQKLTKLKLDQNPLVIPPPEVVEHSTEAVIDYMAERWRSGMTIEDDKKQVAVSNQHSSLGAGRMISWLGGMCGGPSTRIWQQHRSDGYLEQL